MAEDAPLLTLTMIVKDEARTIGKTLASAKPFVDRWVVLDTGSTDGTQDAVREAMRGVPGELHEEPFVDFASTRNRGLDLCGERTPFVLWLDADDELDGGDALRAFLTEALTARGQGPSREAFYVQVALAPSAVRFDSARVLDSAAAWRFEGAVHEVLQRAGQGPPTVRIPGVVVRHASPPDSAAKSRARWERDVALLEAEVKRTPAATRPAFYLALTHYWLGRYTEAIALFDRRVALGGWAEEVFYSHLAKARSLAALRRPWAEVLVAYLAAHTAAPNRAEPLLDVAMHYHHRGEHAPCVLFARRGWELPLPVGALFVEEEAYTWRLADLVGSHAYWLGEYALGEKAARQAAATRPDDARLQQNVLFYVARGAT
jgi:glycosyltransferase involved in cell wall biosynthesis